MIMGAVGPLRVSKRNTRSASRQATPEDEARHATPEGAAAQQEANLEAAIHKVWALCQPLMTAIGRNLTTLLEIPAAWHVSTTYECVEGRGGEGGFGGARGGCVCDIFWLVCPTKKSTIVFPTEQKHATAPTNLCSYSLARAVSCVCVCVQVMSRARAVGNCGSVTPLPLYVRA
jgi:hypothetical protein